MIVLKANPQLKTIFTKLIKTAKEPVEWNGIFLVSGDSMILLGSLRSLFFSLENRKVFSNIADITVNQEAAEDMEGNTVLANVLNMLLYAFGKWGAVSGLKVDKDYAQLNRLFANILKEVNVEAQYREDSFYFIKGGIRITYEEVVQRAVNWGKEELQEDETEAEDEKLGLWHTMRWKTEKLSFSKAEKTPEDAKRGRLGKNFYMTGYCCPGCGKKLYMVVYPVGKEFLIETDEERVYLARAYACPDCCAFYTPRPGRLLMEGDVYALRFEEDRKAYEDYLELLGRTGERCANYKFNEYESRRSQGPAEEDGDLAQLCMGINTLPIAELEELVGRMEEGFYPWEEVAGYQENVEKTLFIRNRMEARRERMRKESGQQGRYAQASAGPRQTEMPEAGGSGRKTEGNAAFRAGYEAKHKTGLMEASAEGIAKEREPAASAGGAAAREIPQDMQSKSMPGISGRPGGEDAEDVVPRETENGGLSREPQLPQEPDSLRRLYEEKLDTAESMSLQELKKLRQEIAACETLTEEEKNGYLERLASAYGRLEEQEILQKAEACKRKPYSEIAEAVRELESAEYSQETVGPILVRLKEIKRLRGEKEVKRLEEGLPETLTETQYRTIKERLDLYTDVDTTLFRKLLEDRRDRTEKQEISQFINKAKKRTRAELTALYEELKKRGYREHNAAPFLEDIYEKIYRMDEAAVERICPSMFGISFEQGLEAFKKVQEGDFLPEIKVKTLEMLEKRLTKMKADENAQLVKKLRRELREKMPENARLHFYDARRMLGRAAGPEEDGEEAAGGEDTDIVVNAMDAYALERGKYEFPILIADSSRAANGKEGFVLTPDHIFYRSGFHTGVIDINRVEGVTAGKGLFRKGLFVLQDGGISEKLPGAGPSVSWTALAAILSEFAAYLKEKPESRKISYLAKENHEVKICYRCGFKFRDGDVCPKCGSKANR